MKSLVADPSSPPEVFYRMVFELLEDLLTATSDPQTLACAIAAKLRELTGAKTVLVMQNKEPFSGKGYRTLCADPPRRSAMADEVFTHAALRLLEQQGSVSAHRIKTDEQGAALSLGLPLLSSSRISTGAILLFDLPVDPNNRVLLEKCLVFLVRYLNETLNNAFVREFQEDLIALHTDALRKEVDERKVIEEILLKSRDEWVMTFDAMQDIVTIQDRDMNILRANRATHEMLNAEFGELVGKKCYELFSGFDTPCPGCPVLATIDDITSHANRIFHKKLGKTFLVNTAPVLNGGGTLEYIVHTAKDITDQIRLEQDLLQAQKMEAVGTLAGGIAHDFNNILSAIIGYAEIIKMGLTPESQTNADVDEIIKSGKRAADLVKQILTFSRKDSATVEIFEPHLIIAESLKMLRSSLPTTVEIAGEIRRDCGYIKANPTRLHQIIMNLCTNALHAMENEKGTLTVNLSRVDVTSDFIREQDVAPGEFILLTVADTGCGMEKDMLDRIFEPYFSTKEVDRGTGLGLAVVHGIVRDSGGFIRIDSSPGRGSRFDIYLPAAEMAGQAVDAGQAISELPTGTEHVLLVDDENAIAQINRSMLEGLGYRTTTEGSSTRALEMFQAAPERYDLILTDQTMPGLTGSDLARAALALRPDLPIILCTGFSSVIGEEEALQIGVRKYLLKPITREVLARSVRAALDGK